MINAKVPASEMTYTDFYIRYERTFLRNIYLKEDRLLIIVILLESVITNRRIYSETTKEKQQFY